MLFNAIQNIVILKITSLKKIRVNTAIDFSMLHCYDNVSKTKFSMLVDLKTYINVFTKFLNLQKTEMCFKLIWRNLLQVKWRKHTESRKSSRFHWMKVDIFNWWTYVWSYILCNNNNKKYLRHKYWIGELIYNNRRSIYFLWISNKNSLWICLINMLNFCIKQQIVSS